jgi:hypothetical protein
MKMRTSVWVSFVIVSLTIGSVFAQDATGPTIPAANARLVRVRIGHSGGMCGGFGYCTELTTVDRSFVVRELKDAPNKKKFPDVKAKRATTKREWENLQRAIDTKSLTTAPQTVCQAIIDLPCSWVEVEFRDGTKIGIFYGSTNPPAPVTALLQKIPSVAITLPVP